MIKGNSTILRAIEKEDLKLLLSWRNNPEFRRYFREYRELNMVQQIQWYENRVNNDISTRMFSITDVRGNLIGAAGLCYIDWINRTADFSIYIGHNNIYIDDFYAPDAANLLIRYGFEKLGLNRLWCEIYSFDLQKIQLFDKLGFHRDGLHRQTNWYDDRWHDSFFFSLLSSDINNHSA